MAGSQPTVSVCLVDGNDPINILKPSEVILESKRWCHKTRAPEHAAHTHTGVPGKNGQGRKG